MANERPRRFTAEQAGDFLSQLLEDQPSDNVTSSDSDWSGEEENDRSGSTGSHRSHPSPRSTSSGELEATADDSTVSSRSSPNVEQSTTAARPRGRPRRQNVAFPRQQEVDSWRQVTGGVAHQTEFTLCQQNNLGCIVSYIVSYQQFTLQIKENLACMRVMVTKSFEMKK